ncbi:MAG: ribonuclease P protein component [Cyclobacteriaceae bacterium]
MTSKRFTKAQRLSSQSLIQELFEKGSFFTLYPFKVYFMRHPVPGDGPDEILISAPSRSFRKAVDRNAIRRRIREAYRKTSSVEPSQARHCIAYIYIAREILPSPVIQEKLVKTYQRIAHEKND